MPQSNKINYDGGTRRQKHWVRDILGEAVCGTTLVTSAVPYMHVTCESTDVTCWDCLKVLYQEGRDSYYDRATSSPVLIDPAS